VDDLCKNYWFYLFKISNSRFLSSYEKLTKNGNINTQTVVDKMNFVFLIYSEINLRTFKCKILKLVIPRL